jgi:flagellar motor switch/type III secretory pathway protein FliN
MAVSTEEIKNKSSLKDNLIYDYPWFYNNFFNEVKEAAKVFFEKEFTFRFLGLTNSENILFYGDEYFVNKIAITPNTDFKIKLSENVVGILLDSSLGKSEEKFDLQYLSDIEAGLINSFTIFLYERLEKTFNKEDATKKAIQNSAEYSFTFYIQDEGKHVGKIIISIPEYIVPPIVLEKPKERFSIDDFAQSDAPVGVCVGTSKITLNDIKALEEGDVIVLENSDINQMAVIWEDRNVSFRINPNPSLIISVNNNGDNEMAEETNTNPQNMWDSILVDIVAEFDNVKLTLGELKQISEGLVIDVGSIYDNKIKLRVENQVVATGELVIINDRYGVRIDEVTKESETQTPVKEEKAPEQKTKTQEKPTATKKPATKAKEEKPAAKEGDENFDYSDFEIEDESI